MKTIITALGLAAMATVAAAQTDVGITGNMASVTIETANGPVEISRIQDTANTLDGEWARTSRPCPEFCI